MKFVLKYITFASVPLLISLGSVFLINPSAWKGVSQYFHRQNVETCWLKYNMNKNEPVLATKIKAACERMAVLKDAVN